MQRSERRECGGAFGELVLPTTSIIVGDGSGGKRGRLPYSNNGNGGSPGGSPSRGTRCDGGGGRFGDTKGTKGAETAAERLGGSLALPVAASVVIGVNLWLAPSPARRYSWRP